MKKLFTTIWNKFISIFKSKKNNQSETKQFVKVFAKKIENDFVVIDALNNEILKETIHPVVSRKERFSSYQKTEIIINNSPILLTEKQIIFYKIILELTEEFGKARAKDICIRYVTKLNKKEIK